MDNFEIRINVIDARHVKERGDYQNLSVHHWDLWNSQYDGWSDENKNYTKFLAELKSLKKICDDDDVKIVYLDDDGDEIPIECDEEFREALHIAYAMNRYHRQTMTCVIKKSEKDICKLEVSDSVNEDKQKQRKMSCELGLPPPIVPKESKAASSIIKTVNRDLKFQQGIDEVEKNIDELARKSKAGKDYFSKVEKSKPLEKNKDTREDVHRKLKTVKHGLTKLRSEKCKCLFKDETEVPLWFKNYMEQFRDELLIEFELLLDEQLGVTDTKASKGVTKSSLFMKPGTSNLPSKSKKLMRKLDELYEKERRLDQRLEKMESKKIKMWEKMASSHLPKSKLDTSIAEKQFVDQLIACQSFPPSSEHILAADISPCEVHVPPSQNFGVVWKLRNVGCLTWTEKTEMKVIFCTPGLVPKRTTETLPPLPPSAFGPVVVDFKAAEEGIYCIRWLLYHKGIQFGPCVQAEIVVEKQKKNGLSEDDQEQFTKGLDALTLNKESDTEEKKIDFPWKNDFDGLKVSSGSGVDSMECLVMEYSDEDGDDNFVVVPMPACFFPDVPTDSADSVPVKVKRKSVQFKEDSSNVFEKANNLSGATEYEEPSEPCQSIEGSVYMVDKSGKCFLINETDPSGPDSKEALNDSETHNARKQDDSDKNVTAQPFLIRDRVKKCVYVDHKLQPFDLPPEFSEKIYQSDPEYYATSYTVCNGVTVDQSGILRPVPGPTYNFYDRYLGPVGSPQTHHPEFNGPFPYTVPAPIPPVVFPPPHVFIPPPPPPPLPPHVTPHPLPPLNPFHPLSSFNPLSPHYIDTQCRDYFNDVPIWDTMKYVYQPNTNTFLNKQNANAMTESNLTLGKSGNEGKEITEENNISDAKSSISQSKPKTRETSGFENTPTNGNIGRKHKLNMFRMKKMKISSDCEMVASDKRISKSEPKKSLYPKVILSTPPVENLNDANNGAVGGTDDKIPRVLLNKESNASEDCTKQAAPVHILPEGLMNGAISAAYSAYSTAVSALNSLRTRPDDMPETDDEKLQRGLAMLYEMGFTNISKNVRLLKQFNYSVEQTVENYCMNLGD
ncbi:uncharacterized protein LOC142329073 isoform X2 [Lycorma delicatula]|uniref:uncharacterized protein LOC142329073 isoform X2 n=1 Tax=Lycorma delicatula TaxID=130591 RepID=UPI003F516366